MKYAKIVWDGENFEVPEELGKPREDQLASTSLDNLCELSGKTCYDALGTGRNSKEYHAHIIEVGHGSVWEHANLTFAIPLDVPTYLGCVEALANRPGLWMCKEVPTILTANTGATFNLRFTANMRTIREWFEFPPLNKLGPLLGQQVIYLAKQKCPMILQDLDPGEVGMPLKIVEPRYEEEKWVSIFFHDVSRGFSHELVRHKFRTAVSQRSTRYVNEADSRWCWHPLVEKNIDPDKKLNGMDHSLNDLQKLCQTAYGSMVEELQGKLVSEGTDKFTARKQARGAARGVLGNALNTELIFSASISQWKWMLNMRAAAAADAEIRVVFNEVFELLSEKFPESFEGWEKVDCPDKIGYAVKEPQVSIAN